MSMTEVRLIFVSQEDRGKVGEIRRDGDDVTLAVSADACLSDEDIANLRTVADALANLTSGEH